MSDDTDKAAREWGYVPDDKRHSFDRDGVSACDRVLFFGSWPPERGGDDVPQCTACKRALQRMRTKG
jgi:hypothetical protein